MDGTASIAIGLRNAPITKLLLGSALINSTLLSILDLSDLFSIDLVPQIWTHRQLWRLGIWQLAYPSFSELLFGSFALYNLSVVERFMGSKRFAAFVTLTYGATSLLVPCLLGVLARPLSSKANFLACGLTPTIFAILFQYHALVPPTTFLGTKATHNAVVAVRQAPHEDTSRFELQDVCTDKLWVYAVAAQIALYRSPSSLIGAAAGWVVGAIYQYSSVLKTWKLPAWLTCAVHERPMGTVVQESPSTADTGSRESAVRSVNPGATRQTISEADIQTLMSMMSVPRDVAVEALRSSDGSLERAVERLLMQ